MVKAHKVYMEIHQSLKSKGYDVYLNNPPKSSEYPFIYLGEQTISNVRKHKEGFDVDTNITVHVWHNNVYERGTFLNIVQDVEDLVIEKFGVRGEEIEKKIIDDPEDVSLIHGVVDIKIKNIKGEC